MLIELDRIGPKGLILNDTLTLDDTLLLEKDSRFLEPVAFKIRLLREGLKVHAVGTLQTSLSLSCVSCLETFTFKIDSNFSITFLPGNSQDEDQKSLNEEDLESDFYSNNQIDIKQLLMEQVNLLVPVRPLCKDECKGLCPNCGTNLNHDNCQCKKSTEPSEEMTFLFNKLKR